MKTFKEAKKEVLETLGTRDYLDVHYGGGMLVVEPNGGESYRSARIGMRSVEPFPTFIRTLSEIGVQFLTVNEVDLHRAAKLACQYPQFIICAAVILHGLPKVSVGYVRYIGVGQ